MACIESRPPCIATISRVIAWLHWVRSSMRNGTSARTRTHRVFGSRSPLREEYAGRDRWRPFLPCPPVDLPDRAVHERGEARSARAEIVYAAARQPRAHRCVQEKATREPGGAAEIHRRPPARGGSVPGDVPSARTDPSRLRGLHLGAG